MSVLNATIPIEMLDSIIPKDVFGTATKAAIEKHVFELKGMSNYNDPLVTDMEGITQELVGGMAFYYRSTKGYNTNIPIRGLVGLKIKGDENKTVADTMKEAAEGAGDAAPSFPTSFKVEKVTPRKNKDGKVVYRFDDYTAFQEKLDELQKLQGNMSDQDMLDSGKLPARRQIFRDRVLINSLVGTEGLSDPTVEPVKDILISIIS